MTMLGTAVKQPAETETYSISYVEDTLEDDTINVLTINIVPLVDPEALLPVLEGYYVDPEDRRLRLFISGGVDGQSYKVEVTVSVSSGRILQDEFRLRIKDF